MKVLSLGLLILGVVSASPASLKAESLSVDQVERPAVGHQLQRVLAFVLAEDWHKASQTIEDVDPRSLDPEQRDQYGLMAGAVALAFQDLDQLRYVIDEIDTSEQVSAWLKFQVALGEAGDQGAIGWTELASEIEILFGDSQILHNYVQYLQSSPLDAKAFALLERVVQQKAQNALEMEIVGASAWELARLALDRGEDPDAWLLLVPPTSNHYGLARYCLDQTEALGGVGFTDLKNSGAESRYELMQRASNQLETGAYEDAVQTYEYARESLEQEHRQLDVYAEATSSDLYWKAWHRQSGDAFINLRTDAWREELSQWFSALASFPGNKGASPKLSGPVVSEFQEVVPPPSQEDLVEVRSAGRDLLSAQKSLEDMAFELNQEEARVQKRLQYLSTGEALTQSVARELEGTALRFNHTQESLDQLLALLEQTKNRVLAHLNQQTRLGEEQAQVHRVWSHALGYFYDREPPVEFPEELPTASERQVLSQELQFLSSLEESLEQLADRVPDRVNRSYEERWLPDLEERVRRIQQKLSHQEALVASILTGIDAHATHEVENPRLLALRANLVDLETREKVALDQYAAVKHDTRLAAVESARELLRSEEEGLEYSLAVAHYERAVFAPGVTDTLSLARAAIATNEAFVEAYPDAPGVAHSKFRLADLYASSAKDAFREDMAGFLSNERRGATPVLEVNKPLQVYADLLETAPNFEHRDAVLFNLGILKLDAGDASGGALLEELIASFPESEFMQEAHLRVGDHLFNQGSFVQAAPHFQTAAEGGDPSLAAIALYQLGWAEFRQDDFPEAVDAFRRLIDLYDDETTQLTMLKSDLRPEAEGYLVHGLVRAGGAAFFQSYFQEVGPRAYQPSVLVQMEAIFRDAALFEDAVAVSELYLEQYPGGPMALSMAERILESYREANEDELAQKNRLDFAERFRKGSTWSNAAPDSLGTAGDQFARQSLYGAASFEHERAQTSDLKSSWLETLRLYEDMLETWPADKHAPRTSLYAGEAALNLKQFEIAMKHYGTASASDTASFAEEANWRQVTTADRWHEHLAGANSDNKAGGQKVAKQLRELARTFAAKYPSSKNGFDGIWRGAELAMQYKQHQEAADDFSRLASQYPDHEKAPLAAALVGDVLFEAKDYAAAAQGYERALGLLEQAGQDSLLVRVTARVPLSYYRHAEQIRDKDGLGNAAPAFEQLATRFPDYEHAPQAMYQSGLGYFESKQLGSGFRVMNDFLVRYPEHELARDTHLQIAWAHEGAGSKLEAAQAYRRYALAYQSETDAVESYLHAMTLLEEAEEKGTLDHFRREFLSAFPEEDDVVMEILHGFAKRELTQISRENPVSKRLEDTESDLAAYLEKSQSSSDLADPDLLGEIAFLQGEEVLAPYLEVYLRLPLNESIEKKKTQLEQVIAAYQRCAEQGSEAWSNAASFRTGYALIHFGDRLEQSERPNLGAEDLAAYEEVIGEEAWTFFDKGEGIWEELLRTRAEASEDPGSWLEKTRKFLWPRLAERFFFRPEMEYPRVEPKEPKVRDMAVSSEALPDEGSSKE